MYGCWNAWANFHAILLLALSLSFRIQCQAVCTLLSEISSQKTHMKKSPLEDLLSQPGPAISKSSRAVFVLFFLEIPKEERYRESSRDTAPSQYLLRLILSHFPINTSSPLADLATALDPTTELSVPPIKIYIDDDPTRDVVGKLSCLYMQWAIGGRILRSGHGAAAVGWW